MPDTPVMPELPDHPEPQTMKWTNLELDAIKRYGADCYRLGLEAGRKDYADLHAAALAVESWWLKKGMDQLGGAPVSIFLLRQALGALGAPPAQEDKP